MEEHKNSAQALQAIDRVMGEMIAHQEAKVLGLGRELVPDLTPEDMRNPQDFPALRRDNNFNFEDGILTGLRAAHMALRSELLAR